MNCSNIQDLIISGYIDKEIENDMLEKIKKHLSECPNCREFEESVILTSVNPFKNIEEVKPPETVWNNIKQKILEKESKHSIFINIKDFFYSFLKNIENILPRRMPAFVAATVITLIIFTMVFIKVPFRKKNDNVNNDFDLVEYFEDEEIVSSDVYLYVGLGTAIEEYLL